MGLTLLINELDFSSFAEENSYTLTYEAREGGNNGVLLDGTLCRDLIAYKAVITWRLKTISSEQLHYLLQQVITEYVHLAYFDTLTHRDRTAEFVPTVGEHCFAFRRHGRIFFRNGTKLTFRER